MAYSAQQGGVEVSRLHNVAICKEIGERLAIAMKPRTREMPQRLMLLTTQLPDQPLLPLPA